VRRAPVPSPGARRRGRQGRTRADAHSP
jgi:hypothetical protein